MYTSKLHAQLGGPEEALGVELAKELYQGAASFLMNSKRKYGKRDFMDWLHDTRTNFDEEEVLADFPHFDYYEAHADKILAAINGGMVNEAAVSKAQQRYFGMVHAGVIPKPKGMKSSDVKKFAKTKHKGLPDHVDEGTKTMRFIDYLITERQAELKEGKDKPDYIDADGDGNKKESMKKAQKDKKKKIKEADIDHHNAAPHLDRKKRQDAYKTKTKSAARHGDDLVVRGVSNRSSIGNYLRKAMRMNEGKRKPDYIDADGDGNRKEPMKKALRDKKKRK